MEALSRLGKLHWPDPRLIDAAIAIGLYGTVIVGLAFRPLEPLAHPTTPLAYIWAAAFCLPFAVHRRYPRAVIVISAIAVIVYGAGQYNGFPGWSFLVLIPAISVHGGQRLGIEALTAGAIGLATAMVMQPASVVTSGTWFSVILLITVAWLVGETLRAGRDRVSAAEEHAQRLEFEREERARQAVAEERLRIARELHDVVAHSMSVIAVQAGVANHVVDSRPDLARDALTTVEAASRSALIEMRRLLGVLRQDDEPRASLTPAPGLDQIPYLVADFGKAGLDVRLITRGDIRRLPAGVDLSAYRITQEALTNALRYGGPYAEVSISCTGPAAEIMVTDPGRASAPSIQGSGHGLIGMRERVAVFGGTLAVGPQPGGGFRVQAVLPFAADPHSDTEPDPTGDAAPLHAEPREERMA